jgi:hypothetical protein
MKNLQLSSLMRDYDYVKRALENPENKHEHIKPLHNLILNFRKKWNDINCSKYLYSLTDIWNALDEKLFEEKLNSKYEN